MLKRPIAAIVVSVVVFCVFAELFSLVIFYYQHGWLFYTDPYRSAHALIPETRDQRLTLEGLHPYFGQTHMPGAPFDIPESLRRVRPDGGGKAPDSATPSRLKTNNFGFVSAFDYPVSRTRGDQFIIGIFGGSVGAWFCQVGVHRLVEDLHENGFFKAKELVPLCFSHEGYKQPQQLLVLAYFLSIGQSFDLVVNIDGFNEVALSSINDQHGVDISMPSYSHMSPLINLVNQATLTPAKLKSLAQISRHKEQLNSLAVRIDQARLASVGVVLEQYYAIVEHRYRAELLAFDALPSNPSDQSVIHVTPAVKAREGATLVEDIARNWIGSSSLMNALLAAQGVPYFHFLQPNQYYTTRTFSSAEAMVALSEASSFKPGVVTGYPALVAASESSAVKNSSLRFFSGIHIFDRESSPVYLDNCCHYSLVGSELLADFIARSVLNSSGPWQSAGK